VKRDPYVDRWLEGKPAEALLRRVRDVIMWADTRIGEYLKYGTVQFAYKGDLAGFVQHDRKTVTLMFNRGAKIQGKFPHLEGTGPSARFMRFADTGEIDARTTELSNVVRAWCDMMAPATPERRGRGRPPKPDSVRSLRAARRAKRIGRAAR
jgi:hypothetical protein